MGGPALFDRRRGYNVIIGVARGYNELGIGVLAFPLPFPPHKGRAGFVARFRQRTHPPPWGSEREGVSRGLGVRGSPPSQPPPQGGRCFDRVAGTQSAQQARSPPPPLRGRMGGGKPRKPKTKRAARAALFLIPPAPTPWSAPEPAVRTAGDRCRLAAGSAGHDRLPRRSCPCRTPAAGRATSPSTAGAR